MDSSFLEAEAHAKGESEGVEWVREGAGVGGEATGVGAECPTNVELSTAPSCRFCFDSEGMLAAHSPLAQLSTGQLARLTLLVPQLIALQGLWWRRHGFFHPTNGNSCSMWFRR